MAARATVSETRQPGDFESVSIRTQQEIDLTITQGQAVSLTIEAPEAIVSRVLSTVKDGRLEIRLGGSWSERLRDAFTTSLSRTRIKYHLTVNGLSELEVFGIAYIYVAHLRAERLAVRLGGPGQVRIESLEAGCLHVRSRSPCRFVLAGHVGEQRVTLDGPGHYDAANLETRKTQISVRGIANATVWAVEELKATIRGPGTVSYYGSPQVVSHTTPIGSLTQLGDR